MNFSKTKILESISKALDTLRREAPHSSIEKVERHIKELRQLDTVKNKTLMAQDKELSALKLELQRAKDCNEQYAASFNKQWAEGQVKIDALAKEYGAVLDNVTKHLQSNKTLVEFMNKSKLQFIKDDRAIMEMYKRWVKEAEISPGKANALWALFQNRLNNIQKNAGVVENVQVTTASIACLFWQALAPHLPKLEIDLRRKDLIDKCSFFVNQEGPLLTIIKSTPTKEPDEQQHP